MATSKEEIEEWLRTLKPGTQVGVDDGGLALVANIGDPEYAPYLEVGGVPED